MDIASVHEWFGWVVVVANGVTGAWAVAANWFEWLRTPALWWALGIAQLSVFVQVILGVVLVAGQGREVAEVHMFYGFLGIVTVAIVYSYRHQLAPHRYLLFGLGGLFLMGLAIQAMFNATDPVAAAQVFGL